jgi:hypothetical protein
MKVLILSYWCKGRLVVHKQNVEVKAVVRKDNSKLKDLRRINFRMYLGKYEFNLNKILS